jgi:hypothetical protein
MLAGQSFVQPMSILAIQMPNEITVQKGRFPMVNFKMLVIVDRKPNKHV